MDLVTLATSAIVALQPLAMKGIEKFVEKSAEEGFNERKAIWDKIKGLFGYDDLTMLNLLEKAESSEKEMGKLEGRLEDRLASNPEIAKELEELLKKIPQSTTVKQNTITQTGNDNVAVQDVQGSNININRK